MAFSYSPLSRSKRQIRLIEIQNGISTGAIMYPSPTVACTMKHFDFDNCPKYRALSYTWGPKHPRTQISVNGLAFSVTEGLASFLERARHLDWLLGSPGYLWIDQITIDQDDLDEREAQVAFMGEIYNTAVEVLVWLGPAADGSSHAMTAMVGLDQREILNHQAALQALFRRRYWTRLWIVQEVLLSRGGKILCGKSWMAWSALVRFMDTMLAKRKIATVMHNSWPVPDVVLPIFLERDTPIERRTLSGVITMFGSYGCDDPRDRVFGLQALIPEHARVPVDYKNDEVALWSAVVRKVAKDETALHSEDQLRQFAARLQALLMVHVPQHVFESTLARVDTGSRCRIQ